MAECKICKGYTKYKNGYCFKCYNQSKSKKTKNAPKKQRGNFPSHTELYRDLRYSAMLIIDEIFKQMGWDIVSEGGFFKKEQTTEYAIEIEKEGWDIIFFIHNTPEMELRMDKEHFHPLLIEYKSSITEWGKQIDQFFRQIKGRKHFDLGIPILLTFDPKFQEYKHACKLAGINLIYIPLDDVKFFIKGMKKKIEEGEKEND